MAIKQLTSCSFRNHPDVKTNEEHSKHWMDTTNGKARCTLKKYIALGKKYNDNDKYSNLRGVTLKQLTEAKQGRRVHRR